MKNYVDISLGRVWQLTVVKEGVQNEYIVPEEQLGALIDSVACELSVQNLRCEPYYNTTLRDVWMTSRPTPQAAA
jgi:hypothetical protein